MVAQLQTHTHTGIKAHTSAPRPCNCASINIILPVPLAAYWLACSGSCAGYDVLYYPCVSVTHSDWLCISGGGRGCVRIMVILAVSIDLWECEMSLCVGLVACGPRYGRLDTTSGGNWNWGTDGLISLIMIIWIELHWNKQVLKSGLFLLSAVGKGQRSPLDEVSCFHRFSLQRHCVISSLNLNLLCRAVDWRWIKGSTTYHSTIRVVVPCSLISSTSSKVCLTSIFYSTLDIHICLDSW